MGRIEKRYAVQRWTRSERGGHFAAMEEPAALIEDAGLLPFRAVTRVERGRPARRARPGPTTLRNGWFP